MTKRAATALFVLLLAARLAGGASPATAPARDDDTPILDRVVPELRLDNVTLEDAIRMIQERTHSNIVMRWEGLANGGTQKSAKVKMHLWDIPVREAIAVLIASAADGRAEIDYSVEGSLLVVSSKIFDSPTYDVKILDVRDLLDMAIARRAETEKAAGNIATARSVEAVESDAARELIDLITSTVNRTAWSDTGGNGTLHIWAGRLFISQLPAVQKHVEELLAKIRKSGDARKEKDATR